MKILPETESIDNQQGKTRQWLANVGSGYADILVGGLVILFLTPVVIRTLGVETYALWILCHTITFYLGFFDIGFGHAQVRFHARWASGRRPHALQGLIATSTAGLLVAGVVAATAGLTIAWLAPLTWFDAPGPLRGDLRLVLTILSVDLLLTFPSAVLSNLYNGAQRFDLANLRSIGLRVIGAAAQLTCLLQGQGIVVLAAIGLGMSALKIAIDLVILSRLLPDLLRAPVRFHRRTWRGIKGYALWSAFEDLLVDGSTQLEQILIAVLLPLALLTPYSLYTTAAGVLLLAVGPISETFLPMAAQLHAEHNQTRLAQLLCAGSKLAVAIAAPAAVFLWVYGNAALAFWSPEGVTGSPPGLLEVIILNFLLSAFLTTSAMMLLAVGRVRTIAILTLIEVVVGVVLIVLLVPHYGLLGVALGLMIANLVLGFAVQVPIAAAVFRVGIATFLWKSLGRVLLAAVPAYVVAVLMRDRVGTGIVAFCIAAVGIGMVFLVALWLIGTSAHERTDYRILWRELRE